MTIERPCPLCGTDQSSALFADARLEPARLNEFAYSSRKLPEYMHPKLLICRDCDLVYASDPPEEQQLKHAYAAAAYDSQIEAEYAARTYEAQVRRLCQSLTDRAAALDIGAGDGAFCRRLKSLGFQQVIGLEPSAAPIAAAKPDVRSCLRQQFFEPGQFPEESFSLITCFQTIEHVSEPRDVCREAVRLLNPNGALCLIAHNRRSLSARLMGHNSPIFDIEHLQLFSPRSLRRLLSDAGLKRIIVGRIFNCYPIAYWTRLFPFPTSIKTMLLRAADRTGLGRIPLIVPAGNLVAWGFR